MKKRLVRVTQLEKFRRFIVEHSEYDTEQSVIDTLTGDFKGNEYTRIGTAFHKIVEGDTAGCKKIARTETELPGREFDIDGFPVKLDINQCKVAVAYRDRFPNAFHEIREYMDFGDIVVTGCADIINGFEIRDIKTKYSPIKDEDYVDSCQWRFYMELFWSGRLPFRPLPVCRLRQEEARPRCAWIELEALRAFHLLPLVQPAGRR